MITIRLAVADDLPAINDIYNYYVTRSTCTYQEAAETMEDRVNWFAAHGEMHPVTVAVSKGEVVGWGSLSPFHRRAAYRNSIENAVYVAHAHHRRGIGRLILADLIERARAAGHHTIIALIDAEQQGSIALHAALGFEHAGMLREAGLKFGRWLDVHYMQLMLHGQEGAGACVC
jgi:phosphinothricin acetyltransferase